MGKRTDAQRSIAFLTMRNPEGFFIYDSLAFEPLQKLGWHAEEVPWDRGGVDWSHFAAVVIRSTWDYQNDAAHFLEVLAEIERQGTRLLNPLAICRWNLQKTYLRDLQDRGVAIVPTFWCERLDRTILDNLHRDLGAFRIVVKPVVGANADDTFPLELGRPSPHQDRALDVFSRRPFMAQPFVESVLDPGEWSLFYFGGRYSHAIIKTPRAGDFRVQEEHGGRIESTVATADEIRAADRVIEAIGQALLYARVDLVRMPDNSLALMELELIEPSLYFANHEPSAAMFAETLDAMLKL